MSIIINYQVYKNKKGETFKAKKFFVDEYEKSRQSYPEVIKNKKANAECFFLQGNNQHLDDGDYIVKKNKNTYTVLKNNELRNYQKNK